MYQADEFNEVVSADIKNQASDEQALWLRTPDIIPAWRDELISILRKVDTQLAMRKEENFKKHVNYDLYKTIEYEDGGKIYTKDISEEDWKKFQVKEASWRISILRLKRAAADKLAECKRLQREILASMPQKDEQVEIVKLRAGIANHKKALHLANDEPSEIDESLWDLLDEQP